MSIASRITAMQEHLRDDYSVLTLAGADLTNVDKNIINLKPTWKERLLYFMNNGTDVVWNNWNKVTGEGTSISLNNTLEAKMKIILKGNTLQNGTPTPESPQDIHVVSGDNSIEVVGENLFTIKNYSKSGYNVKIDNPLKGQSAGTYTISCENLIPNEDGRGCAVFFLNENNQRVGNYFVGYDFGNTLYSNTKNLTQEELDAPYMRLDFNNNNATQEGINRAKIMINKGNKKTYTPYESASYPITLPEGMFLGWIPNTTYQDKIDKSTGKNLFNDTFILGSITQTGQDDNNTVTRARTGYMSLKENTTYSFSSTNSNIYYVPYYYNSSQTFISYDNGWKPQTTPFTTPANTKYVRLLVKNNNTNTIALSEITNPMINLGTTALEYEPYGNIWYVNKQIGKTIINSSTGWGLHNSSTGTKYRFITSANNFLNLFPNIILESESQIAGKVLCNMEQQTLFSNTAYGKFSINASSSVNSCWCLMNFDDSSVTTVNDFNTFISANNAIFYYPLATPTYTLIEDTTLINQLETIKKSYEGQTNITQENNDLASLLNATALREMS